MNKKLYKYLKTLISITMIFAMTFSSYAKLEGSDGSSFVTKAEFDSAISDFTSRLTTFESGINSKIDSQVTSYLDKNGIWSGKSQTLITNYTSADGREMNRLYNFANTTSRSTWTPATGDENYIGFFGLLSMNSRSGWRNFPSGKYAYTSRKIVENVTKEGLCVASLEFELNVDETTTYQNAYLQLNGADSGHEKWFQISHFLTQTYFEDTSIPGGGSNADVSESECYDFLPSDIFGNAYILSPNFQSSNADKKYKTLVPPLGKSLFLGFVEKDKPLYYGIAMIGARVSVYQIAGCDYSHSKSWYITDDTDIRIY